MSERATKSEEDTKTKKAEQVDVSARAERAARGNKILLAVVLVVLNVALLVTAVVLTVRIADKRGGSPDNVALIDQGATQQVIAQVSADALKIFSFNYANAAASQQSALSVLEDPAKQQYLTLVRLLQQNAGGQQLTLVVKIVQAAAVSIEKDQARVLVFLDQTSTRASDKASSTSAAQVLLSAVKRGSVWKVNNITTFSPAPAAPSGSSSPPESSGSSGSSSSGG